jgi:hypothetical protein
VKTSLAVAFALSLCGGCFLMPTSNQRATSPPDGLLVDTSPAQRERVADARVVVGRAKDAVASSQRHHQETRDAVTAAGQRRDAAQAEVAQATLSLGNLERNGSTADVDVARTKLRTVEAARGVEDARCDLRDREVVSAAHQLAVAKARLDVAVAQLELAKVVAVNTLDRPDLQKPDVTVFQAAVRTAEGQEEVARAGLTVAEREVEVRRGVLVERQNGL